MSFQVSVIIPTYNRCERLKLTIESVLKQTFQDFEILVCDDGSTDDTLEMVTAFADERIRWLSGQNSGGPATPRNRGIVEAKGEWLAFLDSDDLWEHTKLEKQVEFLKTKQLMAVCTNAKVLVNGEVLEKSYFHFVEDQIYTFIDMLEVNWVICSSMMIHRSVIEHVGNFPESSEYKAIEDYALWLAASMVTDIYFIAEPLTIYRDEPTDSIRGEVLDEEALKYSKILNNTLIRAKKFKKINLYFIFIIYITIVKNNLKKAKQCVVSIIKAWFR
jgi:glycosyltransferase involved in cell wall biosynthesis